MKPYGTISNTTYNCHDFLFSRMRRIFLLFFPFIILFATSAEIKAAENFQTWMIAPPGTSLQDLKNSDADILIIDTSWNGTADQFVTKEEILALQKSGKKVLARFPVSRAEINRFYWNNAWEDAPEGPCYETTFDYDKNEFVGERCEKVTKPKWLGPQLESEEGYLVQYWSKEWQKVALIPLLKKISAAGFDGIFVEKDEAVKWYAVDAKNYPLSLLAKDLSLLLGTLRSESTKLRKNQDFLIILQNGTDVSRLLTSKRRAQFFRYIDGVSLGDEIANWSSRKLFVFSEHLQFFLRRKKYIFLSSEVLTALSLPENVSNLVVREE
jgi:endo-alpha-1,4-polygalactosaminidase (GH114 family)